MLQQKKLKFAHKGSLGDNERYLGSIPEEAGELAEERGDRLLLLDGGDAGGVADGGLRREVGAVVAEVLLHQRQHHLEEKLDRLLRLLVARPPAGARFNSVCSYV